MKIAVIAAQGRAGQAFVQEALAAGHAVHAGIRGEDRFKTQNNLVTMQCEATDVGEVTKLIDKCDAVVSLLGHVKGSDEFVQTKATETIITAMEVAGISRFVSLTGTGVWVEGDRFEGLIKLLNKVSAKFGVKRFDDGIKHVKVLHDSNLDWTIVRVALLTDGEPGKFKLTPHGPVKIPTPRREVARAILQTLEEGSFVRKYPVVSRP
jgi:putative NADH-flavin reductase